MSMNTERYLSSEQLSHIWTLFSPSTIRELARQGKVPVRCWIGQEPGFGRDSQTIRTLVEMSRRYGTGNQGTHS